MQDAFRPPRGAGAVTVALIAVAVTAPIWRAPESVLTGVWDQPTCDDWMRYFVFLKLLGGALREGTLPLWSTDLAGGYPLFASPHMLIPVSPNGVFATVLPATLAARASVQLTLVLACLAAYTIARHLLRFSRVGAVAFSVVFLLFDHLVLNWYSGGTIGKHYLPLAAVLLLVVERPLRPLTLAAGAYLVMLLAAESVLGCGFVGLLAVVWAGFRVGVGGSPDVGGRAAPLIRLAIVGGLGLALAGAKLVPLYELATVGPRALPVPSEEVHRDGGLLAMMLLSAGCAAVLAWLHRERTARSVWAVVALWLVTGAWLLAELPFADPFDLVAWLPPFSAVDQRQAYIVGVQLPVIMAGPAAFLATALSKAADWFHERPSAPPWARPLLQPKVAGVAVAALLLLAYAARHSAVMAYFDQADPAKQAQRHLFETLPLPPPPCPVEFIDTPRFTSFDQDDRDVYRARDPLAIGTYTLLQRGYGVISWMGPAMVLEQTDACALVSNAGDVEISPTYRGEAWDQNGGALTMRFEGNRIRVEPPPGTSALTINQNCYPGWRTDAGLLECRDGLLHVSGLTGRESAVELGFRPTRWGLGVALTTVAAAILGVFALVHPRRWARRRTTR